VPEEKPWYSARWWLTMMCGVGFLYTIYARILPVETIGIIITTVLLSYFQRSDRNPPAGAAPPPKG